MLAILFVEQTNAAEFNNNNWSINSAFEDWVYASGNGLQSGSVLNPENSIVKLPAATITNDSRFNIRIDHDAFEIVLNPRVLNQINWVNSENTQTIETTSVQLDQGFVKYKLQDGTFVAGREVLNWGPSNFRSPSNPFYFDIGRINPLATTPGIDLVRYTTGIGSIRINAAYVFSTNQILPTEKLGDTSLIKIDQEGRDYVISIIATQHRNDPPFIGGFIQFTPADAWLLYTEFGSSNSASGLGGSINNPYQSDTRDSNSLVGANYTLENGQVITGEFFHNSAGYTRSQEKLFFNNAISNNIDRSNSLEGNTSVSGIAGAAPGLLGQNYCWLSWQSNPQNNKVYLRADWSTNIDDHSSQVLFYIEKNFIPKVSGFALFNRSIGGVLTDYGSVSRFGFTLGMKFFLF